MSKATEEVVGNSYTPTEIGQMVVGAATSVAAQFGTLGFIRVSGVLGVVRPNEYKLFYDVELRDVIGTGILFLDIPKELRPDIFQGKPVLVGGRLLAKNNKYGGKGLYFSMQVTRIEPQVVMTPEALEEERALRELMLLPSLGAQDLPFHEGVVISCIHGHSSQVLADFENAMNGLDQVVVARIPVNMKAPASIAQGVRSAKSDIVVLIRGGGAEGEFEAFNRSTVLLEWQGLASFKISALGHTANTTLLDRFSHRVCSTPTEAGVFLRGQIAELRKAESARRDLEQCLDKIEAMERQSQSLGVDLRMGNFWLKLMWALVALGLVGGLVGGYLLRGAGPVASPSNTHEDPQPQSLPAPPVKNSGGSRKDKAPRHGIVNPASSGQ